MNYLCYDKFLNFKIYTTDKKINNFFQLNTENVEVF